MSRDELIAMAKEARISEMGLNIDGSIHLLGLFERFAALVAAKAAAAERDACAALAASQFRTGKPGLSVNLGIAAAIRARSEQ